MIIAATSDNKQEILALIPAIKANIDHWQIITIRLSNIHKSHPETIQAQLMQTYKDREGLSFITNDNRILLIIKLGNIDNYTHLKHEIEDNLKDHRCRVIVKKMNESNLNQVTIDLSDESAHLTQTLFTQREKRENNVILIAEDDEFIRKALYSLLNKTAEIHEIDNGMHVLDAYQKHNPDIVLLDIHLPNRDGLTLLNDLFDMDYDAFVIVTSADSVKKNVIEALSLGAAGFLAKPIQKKRLDAYLKGCITYQEMQPQKISLEEAI